MAIDPIRLNEIYETGDNSEAVEVSFVDPDKPVAEWGVERFKVVSKTQDEGGKLVLSALAGSDPGIEPEEVVIELDSLSRGANGTIHSPTAE